MIKDCGNKIITAYNDAKFDFYVPIDEVNHKEFYVHHITISNNRVLDFTCGGTGNSPNIRIFDLY